MSETHVSAVALNVTATNTTADGFLTVSPLGARPATSSLNWSAGETVPNAVITKVEESLGMVAFANHSGRVDVLADISGFFDDGSPLASAGYRFAPIAPARIVDTRIGQAPPGPGDEYRYRLMPDEFRVVRVVGGAVPLDAAAVMLNVTVDDPKASGHVGLHPYGVRGTGPPTSTLNHIAGRSVANGAIAVVGVDGCIVIANVSQGTIEVLVDVSGAFVPAS